MNPLDITELGERLYLVNTQNNGRFPDAYGFLVKGRDTTALIDTGCGLDVCRALKGRYSPDLIINSHSHPDHIAGNFLFKGTELLVPEQGMAHKGRIDKLAKRLVGPEKKIMEHWEAWVRGWLGLDDYTPTRTFSHGDVLDFGGIRFEAIHCPGHLDDHYCFWEPESRLLLSFDIDLTGFGPWYGNPEGDISRFMDSVRQAMELDPLVVASSHRLPVKENPKEELQAFLDKFHQKEQKVLDCLETPLCLDEIVLRKPLYGRHPPGTELMYAYFEKNMVEKHLERLLGQGRIIYEDGMYGRAE